MLAITLAVAPASAARQERSLAERLGYKATDRILIINGDDTGMCHTANVATIAALEKGLMTSATIMVPCPWFPEIAQYAKEHPELSFGLHLTHTSEWQTYRWGPVANKADVPGLVDPDGYLWRSVEEVYKNATPVQAEIEGRAQIKKALKAGINVTHLDSHMGTLQVNAKYLPVYYKLAKEFDLPLRMGSKEVFVQYGLGDLREVAAKQGTIFPDHLVHGVPQGKDETRKAYWTRIIRGLKPGVSELYIHAGARTEEMKSCTYSTEERATDAELFTTDPDMKKLLDDLGIIRIGFRPLRDLQRKK